LNYGRKGRHCSVFTEKILKGPKAEAVRAAWGRKRSPAEALHALKHQCSYNRLFRGVRTRSRTGRYAYDTPLQTVQPYRIQALAPSD